MEFRHLQHFIALAQEGSFTRAARKVNIVQSGLSNSIKELEEELGSRLVERTTRKVAITETGMLFLPHARATLAALEGAVQAVRSQDGVVRGQLRLGILQSLGSYLELAPLLKQFRCAFPRVDVSVRALIIDTVPGMVRSGEIDLGFRAIIDRDQWPGIKLIPYMQDPLVAVCSANHPLASRSSVTIETLSNEVFVDLTLDRGLRRLVDKVFAQHHLKRTTAFEVSEIQTAIQFVANGLGVAIVPSAVARSFKETWGGAVLRISKRDGRLPAWRVAILRRTKQKRLTGTDTVDLFLDKLAAESRRTKYMPQVSLVTLTGNSSTA
jgi:DNA-binding transcriptional LysR family regulator